MPLRVIVPHRSTSVRFAPEPLFIFARNVQMKRESRTGRTYACHPPDAGLNW